MFNRYAYVGNDPVNMVDPDGRNPAAAVALCAGPQALACAIGGVAIGAAALCYFYCDDVAGYILESRRRSPTTPCIDCSTPTGGVTETGRCPDCEVKARDRDGRNRKWWENDEPDEQDEGTEKNPDNRRGNDGNSNSQTGISGSSEHNGVKSLKPKFVSDNEVKKPFDASRQTGSRIKR